MTYRDLLIAILLLGFCSVSLMNPDIFSENVDHSATLLLNGEAIDLKEPLPLDTQGALGIILFHEQELLAEGSTSPGLSAVLVRKSKPLGEALKVENMQPIGGLRIEQLIRGARSGDRLLMEITHLKRRLHYTIHLR